jgi:hypothetical protein
MDELTFLTCNYNLDQSDPDAAILRRQDGSLVAAFSARGVTKEGILEAAKEDRRKWLRPRDIDYMICGRSGGELKNSR